MESHLIWTYFTGTEEDIKDFVEEWKSVFNIEVEVEIDTPKDPRENADSWYCQTWVTQEQIEEFNLLSDWIESN